MYQNYKILKLKSALRVKKFIEHHHYLKSIARGCHNNYVLVVNKKIIGVAQFGYPISPKEAKSTIELKRFVLSPNAVKNTGSWFMSKCLKNLEGYDKVITFADPKQKHTGTLYKAANFNFVGEQIKKGQVIKEGKKLHHLRKCYQRKRNGNYTQFAQYIQAKLKLGKAKFISVPKKLKFEYNLNRG